MNPSIPEESAKPTKTPSVLAQRDDAIFVQGEIGRLRTIVRDHEETIAQLVRALREAAESETFMGEPTFAATPQAKFNLPAGYLTRVNKWGRLYSVTSQFVAYLGAYGSIDANSDLGHSLVRILDDIDGANWCPGLLPEPLPEEEAKQFLRCATAVSKWLGNGCPTLNMPKPHIAALVKLAKAVATPANFNEPEPTPMEP